MHPKTTVSGVHRLSLLWQRWTVMFKSVSSFKIVFFHYTSQDILWWMVSIRDRSFPTMQRQYHKRAVESGNGYHVFAGDTFAYRSKAAECRSLLLWWRHSRKGPCGPFPVSLKKYVCFAVKIRSSLKAMQCSYSSVPCCILRRKDSTICLASISLRVFKRIPTGKRMRSLNHAHQRLCLTLESQSYHPVDSTAYPVFAQGQKTSACAPHLAGDKSSTAHTHHDSAHKYAYLPYASSLSLLPL